MNRWYESDLYFFRHLRRGSWHWRQRQFDGDLQSVRHILGANVSAVQLHGALGDRETQPYAAAGPFAGFAHTIKGFKDMLQVRRRHPRTVIADGEHCGIEPPIQSDIDRCPWRGVANAVAHHVLHCAAQEFKRTADPAFLEMQCTDFTVTRLGFEGGIVDNLLHQIFENYRFRRNAFGAALQASECQELPYEFVHPLRFLLNPVQSQGCPAVAVFARQLESYRQPG